MTQLHWYTQDDGRLCLGVKNGQMVHRYFATRVYCTGKIDMPVHESHIAVIGHPPEHWHLSKAISAKINHVAERLFGDDCARISADDPNPPALPPPVFSDLSLKQIVAQIEKELDSYAQVGFHQIGCWLK